VISHNGAIVNLLLKHQLFGPLSVFGHSPQSRPIWGPTLHEPVIATTICLRLSHMVHLPTTT